MIPFALLVPAGSDTEVQYNDGNLFGADSTFTFNGITKVVSASELVLTTPLAVPYGGTGAATLTDGGFVLGSGVGAVTVTPQPVDGQLPIGSTGTDPALATITGSASINVVNGAGSITLSVIPGGVDHSGLTNLAWTSSGHTGTASTIASFSGAGAAQEISDSAGLAANISDETGSGPLVFATSPTLTTPNVTGRLDVDSGAGDEVIRMTANSSPYITWYEGATRRVYIQYIAGTNILRFAAEEAGSQFSLYTANTEAIRVNASQVVDTKSGRISKTRRVTVGESPFAVPATEHIIFFDTDGGAIEADLPAGVDGTHYKLINVGSSGNDLTVDPNGTEQIYGSGAGVAATVSDGEVINIHYNVTEGWY